MDGRVKCYQKWAVAPFRDACREYDPFVNKTATLPRWLGPVSRLNLLFLRLGFKIGSQHALSVPGRKTGKMRSTPVSLVILDGQRYIVSGESLSWVKNARAAGWGELLRTGHRERVELVEVPADERGPILRAFWHQVRGGRRFMARLFGLPSDASADDFAAAAPRCPVFRVEQTRRRPT